jgi:hypothetical protein
MNELYERQKELNLEIPNKATVLGCGGVGFWVAYDLAMIGTKEITLIDHDVVEAHNLNRCGWEPHLIGENKAVATAKMVTKIRDLTLHPLTMHIDNCEPFQNILFEPFFDNRDSDADLPDFCPSPIITGGYDGLQGTLHFHPKTKSFGDEETEVTYSVTPSFLVPAQIIACYKVLFACSPKRTKKEKIINIDFEEMIM